MPALAQEEKVILHWLAVRRAKGLEAEHPRWLDRGREGDIDALAPPFAIEHTSIDALPQQRQVQAQFRRVADAFREIPFESTRLRLAIDYEAFTAVDHDELLSCLRQWLRREASDLPEGSSKGLQLCGLPVRWWAFCHSDQPSGAVLGLAVDSDTTSSAHVGKLLGRKARKLRAYKRRSFITVLIVESDDLALMDAGTFHRMCDALPLTLNPVDELWFADTSLGDVELWHIPLDADEPDGPFYAEVSEAV